MYFILSLPVLLLMGLFFLLGAQRASAEVGQLPARCDDNGDFSSTIEVNQLWEEDVYIGRNLTIRNSAVVTIQPGVQVFFCGDFNLQVSNGQLMAVGTPDEPIVFTPAPGNDRWKELRFTNSLPGPSVLRHAVLVNGGGKTPGATDAALVVASNYFDPVNPAPYIDHIEVAGSSAYGIHVQFSNTDDPTPPALSNLTVRNSVLAPIIMEAAAVGGLGEGNLFEGNGIQAIQIHGDSGLGAMFYDIRWRKQPVPYEVLGSIYIRNEYNDRPYSTWTIDPGTTVWVNENKNLTIGSLFGDSRLVARGTISEPITITLRVPQSGTAHSRADARWGAIQLSNWYAKVQHELAHVVLGYGGASNHAVLNKTDGGTLLLEHVEIHDSASSAVYLSDGHLVARDSIFRDSQFGIEFYTGATGLLRSNQFVNLVDGAAYVHDPRYTCIDAAANWWGAASGPQDLVGDKTDLCASNGRVNPGSGAGVTDGVAYWPWLTSGDPAVLLDRSSISPGEQYFVAANGVDQAELTITVRDANGAALPGKTIILSTTLGTITQPVSPTDAQGQTTAYISSAAVGDAVVTGYNQTDEMHLGARLELIFWVGRDDSAGLVNLSGLPYAAPELIFDGLPFQAGLPAIFRLPMQNTLPNPQDVFVRYSVTQFGLGLRFQEVATVTKVLQPGETFDFPGGYLLPDSQHRCVLYEVTAVDLPGRAIAGGGFSGSRNLDWIKDACNNLDADDLVPDNATMRDLQKHIYRMNLALWKISHCISLEVNFRSGSSEIDYLSLADIPLLAPPPLLSGLDVTPAEAAAVNALSETSAQINGRHLAMQETQARIVAASRAGAWNAAADQGEYYRELDRQRVALLREYASQIDDLLAVLDPANDVFFNAEDYEAYLAELKTTGFNQATLDFYDQVGLPAAAIQEMLETTIVDLEAGTYYSKRFSHVLHDLKLAALQNASGIERFLRPIAIVGGRDGEEAQKLTRLDEQEVSFLVGNPNEVTSTVKLVVRTGDMPFNWTYRLSEDELVLGPEETAMVVLTLTPGAAPVLKDAEISVMVEGYIGTELIGGVQIKHLVPVKSFDLFLPLVLR